MKTKIKAVVSGCLFVVVVVGSLALVLYGVRLIGLSRRFEACTKQVTASQYTCTDQLSGDCWVMGGTRHPGLTCADLAKAGAP